MNLAAQQQQQAAAAHSLRAKKSMPDMKTLHTQAPRLASRASNGNLQERYATIASPSRRPPGGFGALFNSSPGTSAAGGSAIPPVPSLPSLPATLSTSISMNGLRDAEIASSNVLRQPRGPSGGGGFGARRERQVASETAGRGLSTQSHEPLEI